MIQYIKKDLFKSIPPSILAHACNTHGIWGGGIAYQFAHKFPSTEQVYIDHCSSHTTAELLGTTLLIPSSPQDPGNTIRDKCHVIACLFTSAGGGGNADGVREIVKNTERAVADLENQLDNAQEEWLIKTKGEEGWVVEMPKINAGIFRVPWEDTEKVLQKSKLDYNVYVVD